MNSIMLKVDDNIVFVGKAQEFYTETTISGDSTDYQLTYHPSVHLEYSKQIEIIVAAQDLANPVNQMLMESYFFTTEQETGVHHEIVEIPDTYVLHQNFPNPFNPGTMIVYELPERDYVNIRIYDITGRTVKTLVNREIEAGIYNIFWSGITDQGGQASSGVYLCKMKTRRYRSTKKIIKLE